jgi:hypothetical protein
MVFPRIEILNLTDPAPVGPLRIPRKQYVQLLGSFLVSVGFAALIAGLANGLIVAGLWLITLAPIVHVATLLRRWKVVRERRLQEEAEAG